LFSLTPKLFRYTGKRVLQMATTQRNAPRNV